MQHTTQRPAEASGTLTIGGDLKVYRLGFGAMRLTGEGIWGPPANKQEAIAVLHRALELGINLIDTADSYGPEVSELLIAEALYPYPKDLVIATKVAFCALVPVSGFQMDALNTCVRRWREACDACASSALTSINSTAQTPGFPSKTRLASSRK